MGKRLPRCICNHRYGPIGPPGTSELGVGRSGHRMSEMPPTDAFWAWKGPPRPQTELLRVNFKCGGFRHPDRAIFVFGNGSWAVLSGPGGPTEPERAAEDRVLRPERSISGPEGLEGQIDPGVKSSRFLNSSVKEMTTGSARARDAVFGLPWAADGTGAKSSRFLI